MKYIDYMDMIHIKRIHLSKIIIYIIYLLDYR